MAFSSQRRLTLFADPVHSGFLGPIVERFTFAGFGVNTIMVDHQAQARQQAQLLLAGGPEMLVVVGDDLAISEAIQTVAHTALPLGLIALGSRTSIASVWGLPVNNGLRAADVVIAGHVRGVDLGKVHDRYFAGALVAGHSRTRTHSAARRYTVSWVDPKRDGPARRTEQVAARAVRVDLKQGQLCVRVVPHLFSAPQSLDPSTAGREVTLACPGVVAYADGFRVGTLPLTLRAAPQALRVLAPATGDVA